ncbi:tautomerase family protein [Marinobacter salicampi]|uniref:tautomerase family protein n=1 Tax=Marinobacter salicampi TaxID=435907 RepID=UPI00140B2757|nr:tautomerase family protein [Marinobacter salicampi]
MPTYRVTSANLTLSQEQKLQIARAITTAHSAQTGAPGFLAQVFFSSVDEGDHFIGGAANSSPYIFVSGFIRSGRSTDTKQDLMNDVLEQLSKIAGITPEDIWIYLQEIPPAQMIEFGRFLPTPGQEEEWKKAISSKKQTDFSGANISF